MQWGKSQSLDGQVLHTERNETYQKMISSYTANKVQMKWFILTWWKGVMVQNYPWHLFTVLMERKIQKKCWIGSSPDIFSAMMHFSIKNTRSVQKLKSSYSTAFGKTQKICGLKFRFIFLLTSIGIEFPLKWNKSYLSWTNLCSNYMILRKTSNFQNCKETEIFNVDT